MMLVSGFVFGYIVIWTGFFVYCICAYFKIYKNKELKDIKKINADDFIRSYIDEIHEKFSDDKYILTMIILLSASMLFAIIAMIIFLCQKFLKRSSFNTMNKEKEKENNTENTTTNVTAAEKAIPNITTP